MPRVALRPRRHSHPALTVAAVRARSRAISNVTDPRWRAAGALRLVCDIVEHVADGEALDGDLTALRAAARCQRAADPPLVDRQLVGFRADNPGSAALSIAANRASKIDLLLSDRTERCDRMARRNADSLISAVCAELAAGRINPAAAQQVATIAVNARDRAYQTRGADVPVAA